MSLIRLFLLATALATAFHAIANKDFVWLWGTAISFVLFIFTFPGARGYPGQSSGGYNDHSGFDWGGGGDGGGDGGGGGGD